jgi:hypothetical protein
MNSYHYKPGDRVLRGDQFLAIKKAIEQIADASQELGKGVKALQDAYKGCCIHMPGPEPAPTPAKEPRKVPHERAS